MNATSGPSAPLRVMTYNVRYFGHGTRGLASTAGALRRIAASIAQLVPLPDVVCLQEVETASLRSTLIHPREHHTETQLERFVAALHGALQAQNSAEVFDGEYFHAHNYRLTESTSFYTTGLAILVRRPWHFFRHNAARPADITHRQRRPTLRPAGNKTTGWKQTRICAHAVVEDPQGWRYDFFNTHLSLPAFYRREFWTQPRRMGWGHNQLEEARQLLAFIERERSSDRFLVMGDLNSLPGSPVYDYLTVGHQWQDALAVPLEHDLARLQQFATAGFMHLRMHIDHVFFGPGLRWFDSSGTHPFGDRRSPFHGLSDHVPILGRFTVAENGAIDPKSP